MARRDQHHSNTASSLGDFLNSNCRTTIDPTVGTGGVIPCSTVVEGANKTARFRTEHQPLRRRRSGRTSSPVGRVNLRLGLGRHPVQTGIHYQQQRSVNVLIPGTTTNAGPTETYFYEPEGLETTPIDLPDRHVAEATFTIWSTVELGSQGRGLQRDEPAEPDHRQQPELVRRRDPAATTSCSISRATFGTATARGSYQAPRAIRGTALVRF